MPDDQSAPEELIPECPTTEMRQRRTTGEVHQKDCGGGLAPRRQQQQGSERLKDARRGVPNGSGESLGLGIGGSVGREIP